MVPSFLLLLLILSICRGLESNSSIPPPLELLHNASDNIGDGNHHTNTLNTTPPSLCWLMSFPNSGTSFTSRLVRQTTGTNTASNYGKENRNEGEDGTSVAVFPDSLSGPFYTDPLNKDLVRPTKGFLLTKTHCGGRCNHCSPEKYTEHLDTFSQQCFEGEYIIKDKYGIITKTRGSYGSDRLSRAIHLVRNPFDNIVSRFHLSLKQFQENNQTDKLAMYPNSRIGFRSFCKRLGGRFNKRERAWFDHKHEKSSRFFRYVFDDNMKRVPCHSDFFRYIQVSAFLHLTKTMVYGR